MSETTERLDDSGSAWALGGVAFAATVLIMIGVFQVIQGLAAIIDDDFFVAVDSYAFSLDLTAWGWIHLLIGIVLAVTGFLLLTGSAVASGIALAVAVLTAIANFFFIPYYPFWSLLIIALSVFVIWSIAKVSTENLQ